LTRVDHFLPCHERQAGIVGTGQEFLVEQIDVVLGLNGGSCQQQEPMIAFIWI
jgi:hypothetical protein